MNDTATWLDLARAVVGDLSEEDCHALLWNATCYPFGGPEKVIRTLRESWEGGGKTVAGAIDFAHAELDRAMDEYRSTKA
jgi:hypothetical protein